MVQIPQHVAIVMDGNGRWAKARGLPRLFGHRAGMKALERVAQYCKDVGIRALTVFAFSTENWQRPAKEVSLLHTLFAEGLRHYVPKLHAQGARVHFIGDVEHFHPKLNSSIQAAVELTQHNTALDFTIAINYSGRWDILQASRQLAKQVEQGNLTANSITEQTYAACLALAELPPVDLFIRTGGEMRISNFMLWQIAYAELYFSELYWPEFGKEAMDEALLAYAKRERRFGKTSEQLVQ